MLSVLAVVGLVACVTCAAATPLVREIAPRLGLVDRPDGKRKLHGRPTALGGGVAVLAGLVAATVAASYLPGMGHVLSIEDWQSTWPAAAAALGIVLLGLVDDRVALKGWQKLAGQLLVVGLLVSSGWVIRRVHLLDAQIDLGLLAVPFTVFWLLGAINALNLIDGIDGLASSVGTVLCIALGGMALVNGCQAEAIVAIALAGSLLGFLCFNFPPAKIFLGDAGSMLIGLVVGVIAMRASLKGPATVAVAAPLAVLAIPILDCSAAIVRRKLTGRSICDGDRKHLHHCMLARLGSVRLTVGWIAACCAVTAAGALASVCWHNEGLAVISATGTVGLLMSLRVFGHEEAALVGERLKSAAFSLLRSHPQTALLRRLRGGLQLSNISRTGAYSAMSPVSYDHPSR